MAWKDPEKRKKWLADYRNKNREAMNAYQLDRVRARRAADPGYEVRLRWEFKCEVIEEYGGKCVCCGEENPEFLSIDHVEGNGNKHRKEITSGGGIHFYRWLRKQGYPKDKYRLLCMNCQCSHGWYGYCPHQRIR